MWCSSAYDPTVFSRSWEPAKATIVEKRKLLTTSETNGFQKARFKFVLDVEVPGKPSFRTTLKSPSLMPDKFVNPALGQIVPVKADAERQKAKWDRSPEANLAVLQDNIAKRQAAAEQAPLADRAARLERLAKLKDQGALTDAEHERARKDVEKS